MLPLKTDSPLRSTPWMNWALIALNLLIFAWQHFRPGMVYRLELTPADPSLLRYFTYAFAHASSPHLFGNMLFLYVFGNNVNDKMGHVGYLGFYLAGAVFAGVGHMASGPMLGVIGASGAVAAVTGAYLVLLPRSHVSVLYWFLIPGLIEIPSMWFVAFFFVKELVFNFGSAAVDAAGGGGGGGVAHIAHLSGAAFGFVVCFVLLSVHLLPRSQFDVVALVQRWNKRRQYRSLVAQGYDPFAYEPVSATVRIDHRLSAPPDPVLQKIQDLRAEISESIAHHNHPHAATLFLELKKLDPRQVLSRQAQLDVANQLASQQLYVEAAEAYEQFLYHYKTFEQIEQVELMLGLLYARYLGRYDRAKEYLLRAMARLSTEREIHLAREELKRIEPLLAAR